jgi:RNA polymerase sigma-70 factor (ECF subfamily)
MDCAAAVSEQQQREWLQRTAQGDRAAFEQLFRHYFARVFRYVVHLVREPTQAEEVVDDVMFELWRQAASFKGEAALSTWIYGIARHKALNARRGPAARRGEPLDATLPLASADPGPAEQAEAHDTLRTVLGAMRELPPEQREVVELALQHELAYEEIAQILACPLNTVKSRMFYARRKLREALHGAAETPGGRT